jgi:hypothetical protein
MMGYKKGVQSSQTSRPAERLSKSFPLRHGARLRERTGSLLLIGGIAGFWAIVVVLDLTVQALSQAQIVSGH